MYNKGTTKRMMKSHIGQLQRAAGGKGTGSRYEYILSQDELMNAYMQSRKDLNYALRKEAKRDRFVMNSAGVQKEMNKICNTAIQEASKQMAAMIEQDARNAIERAMCSISGTPAPAANSRNNNTGALLGRSLANGLMKGIGGILDDMMSSDDY